MEEIRAPDNSFLDRLVDNESNAYNISDVNEMELYNAIKESVLDDERHKNYMRNEKRYIKQLEDAKIEMEQKTIDKEKSINMYISNLKKDRMSESLSFDRAISISSLHPDVISEIKKSLTNFRNLDCNYIFLNQDSYDALYEFIYSKKHRLKEEYIKIFIDKYIEIDDNSYADDADYEYNYDDN